uniref:rRNA-processing protein EBP2 n=1 Tax=Ascaris suum TaxID=6253 RepID=F1L690_ASCSU
MDPKAVDDDFEREIVFYKQAQEAVQTAIPRLLKMGIKVFRPSDYYAEMAKSDEHMQKVRKRMLDLQQGKERQEAIRRLREEKKFAAKVQKEVLENRQSEKRKLLEAVKRHRKGMKSQLDDMLNNAKRLQRDEAEEENEIKREREAKKRNRQEGRGNLPMRLGRRMGRTARDKKYGFGGQKKRSKRNDKQSFNEFSSHAMRNSRRGSGKPTSGRGRFRGIKRR